jgi:hypothetical protein
MRFVPRVVRETDGRFRLELPREERDVLRTLPAQLRELLAEETDPALRRLFPPAYADDPAREAEFREMVRDELLEGKLAAIATMEATLDAERLTEEELLAWLGALNDLRLVLGTRLDVTEETDFEDFQGDAREGVAALYRYLGALEEDVVEALAGEERA